ncbi:divalent metal cation transporter [uncultured Dokdonia sp.]|uniref:NRAMP family divalent metal transporter n=1 Tax=uncultured Dokdonia sp. TaxID=575653 RepID=UPI00262A5EF7|nr:divalent metal cation transporter [uncultured Dokdonia sp.]
MSGISLKKLGPGLLFAGAAIGVSHLVQSTKAGGYYGFGLLWALLLINIIKYPSFQFGPRYAAATGNSLLHGYRKLGKGVLVTYFALSLLTMFTIQTAVTIVTAGLAVQLFGLDWDIAVWSVVITIFCSAILAFGRYKLLDSLMKVIILVLTVSTLFAVLFAFRESIATEGMGSSDGLIQLLPTDVAGIAFLIAFMGWMPAPLDISIFHSLWTVEKGKSQKNDVKTSLFDFNVGYLGTVVLGICFVTLGALVMFGSGDIFSDKGGVFAGQLISMYTTSLGDWATILIGVAAFTTMFSTTLTTLDASPRAMSTATNLLGAQHIFKSYLFWLILLILGTCIILFFFVSEMGLLIKVATILSFLTAPFYAICNYLVFKDPDVPEKARLGILMKIYSIVSIILLIAFSGWYVSTLF